MQYIYQHAEDKKIYLINNNSALKINKNDHKVYDTYYINKDYNKLQFNFMGIISTCGHYATSFWACSALNRHIKSGCNTPGQVTSAKTGIDLTFIRSIFFFAVKLSTPGSGLAFRGWMYTNTVVTFEPIIKLATNYPNASVYLDTSCRFTPVYKAWVAKKLFSQIINAMPVPLKVKNIGAS